jgi:hypothetical protein
MSAFLVSDSHISQVVSGLLYWCDLHHRHPIQKLLEARPELADIFYPDTISPEAVAVAAHRLNVEAIHARYGGDHPSTFTFRPSAHVGQVELYKLAGCWLYQCSEGTCDSDPLYHFVKEVKNCIGNRIIAELPAFKAAPYTL